MGMADTWHVQDQGVQQLKELPTELFHQLQQRVKVKQQERSAIHASLTEARTRYLEKALLLQEIKQLCSTSAQTDPALRALVQRQQVADAVQWLGLQGAVPPSRDFLELAGSCNHWLGVMPDDLMKTCDTRPEQTQEICRVATPLVSEHLQSRLGLLQQAMGISSNAATATITSDKRASGVGMNPGQQGIHLGHSNFGQGGDQAVHEKVVARTQQVSYRRLQLSLAMHQQLQLCAQLVDVLCQTMSSLHGFMETELAGRQQQHSTLKLELDACHTRSLCYKMRHVEAQLLKQTYDTPVCMLPALQNVHTMLTDRTRELELHLKQVREQVSAYEALGPAFQQVVAAYTRVCAELRSAQQTLSTFTELEKELLERDRV